MEQPTGRRKLAAILMADVVDYGRHMGEDETATIRTLKAHRAVFANHTQQRYGRVMDAKGDAIMAAFDSVVDAVAASVEIQREIATANGSLPGPRQMRFRIGINLGDIVEEPDSIYGDGVTVSARCASPGASTTGLSGSFRSTSSTWATPGQDADRAGVPGCLGGG